MPDFTAIAEQFRHLNCSHCETPFTPDAVTPLRQESDYWVVRVVCTACKEPSGVAVVGTEVTPERTRAPRRAVRPQPERPFASRREEARFADKPAITADDVLDASRAIRALGSDWARLLPKRR